LTFFSAGHAAEAGAITTYSDRTTFETDLGAPISVEDFTDSYHFPITTGILNSATNLTVDNGTPITPGLILPGVTYSTPVGLDYFFNIDVDLGALFTGGLLDGMSGLQPLTASFDDPVHGFGFDTSNIMGSEFSITIKFSSGPDYVQTFPIVDGVNFFGFVSTTADIQSAEILGNGGLITFALDNFTYPTPAAVPEPSSVVLVGVAALSGLTYRRRKRRA
jgi:hypothetical protein